MRNDQSTFIKELGYMIDEFDELQDLRWSDLEYLTEYRELTMKKNDGLPIDQARLDQLEPRFKNKIVTSARWNKFQNALVGMQTFIKEEIEDFVKQKQIDIDTAVKDGIDMISKGKDDALISIEKKKENILDYMDSTTAGAIRNDIGDMTDSMVEGRSLVDKTNNLKDQADGMDEDLATTKEDFSSHLDAKASLTKLGHVKAETDAEGNLVLNPFDKILASDGELYEVVPTSSIYTPDAQTFITSVVNQGTSALVFDENYIYLFLPNESKLNKYNKLTLKLVASVSISIPRGMIESGDFLYVGHRSPGGSESMFSKIRKSNLTSVATSASYFEIFPEAVEADDELFVMVGKSNTRSIQSLNKNTLRLERERENPGNTLGNFSVDSEHIYYLKSSNISKIRRSDFTPVPFIAPAGSGFFIDNVYLYILHGTTLRAIDKETGDVVKSINLHTVGGSRPIRAFIHGDNVYVYAPAGLAVVDKLSLLEKAIGFDATPRPSSLMSLCIDNNYAYTLGSSPVSPSSLILARYEEFKVPALRKLSN